MGNYEVMDNADFIEVCELELWDIINKMHRAGVRFSVVNGILQEITETLELQGYCEDWLSQFNKGS